MKTQHLSFDIFTTLPQPIIETILCLLPIEDAVRTSILSREWRYKWTTIPKLVFHEINIKRSTEEIEVEQLSDLEFEKREEDMNRRFFYAVHRVLFLHQGPIHEFKLSMTEGHTFGEVDQVILHLSRNYNVKKLTLDFFSSSSYSKCLPLSVFSLHHLTDLDLQYCDIRHKPIFNRLGSLTSLSLTYISISTKSLLHLLSSCPSLKSLCLILVEEDFIGDEKPSIMELLKCLPAIERLTTWGYTIQSLVQDSVPEETPTSLIHLKYVFIRHMFFFDAYGLPFLAVLIKCCPNLEKLKIMIADYLDNNSLDLNASPSVESNDDSVESEDDSNNLEKYSDVWLEHLNELEIKEYSNFQLELKFVKCILARSPNLKKLILRTDIDDKNEELELLNILLRAPRPPHASPIEINVGYRLKYRF